MYLFFDLGSLLEKRHWVYQVLLRNSAPTRIMWKLDHTNSAKINSKIIKKKPLISDLKLESVKGKAKATPLRYQQSY